MLSPTRIWDSLNNDEGIKEKGIREGSAAGAASLFAHPRSTKAPAPLPDIPNCLLDRQSELQGLEVEAINIALAWDRLSQEPTNVKVMGDLVSQINRLRRETPGLRSTLFTKSGEGGETVDIDGLVRAIARIRADIDTYAGAAELSTRLQRIAEVRSGMAVVIARMTRNTGDIGPLEVVNRKLLDEAEQLRREVEHKTTAAARLRDGQRRGDRILRLVLEADSKTLTLDRPMEPARPAAADLAELKTEFEQAEDELESAWAEESRNVELICRRLADATIDRDAARAAYNQAKEANDKAAIQLRQQQQNTRDRQVANQRLGRAPIGHGNFGALSAPGSH